MPDEQPSQKQWPDQGQGKSPPPLGTGEGEVPLAQPPREAMFESDSAMAGAAKPSDPVVPSKGPGLDMRTSASDVESIQKEGGGAPKPYTPPPVLSEKPPGVSGTGVSEEHEKEQVFQPPR